MKTRWVLLTALVSAPAVAAPNVAVLQPGGGWMLADGRSWVPLQVEVQGGSPLVELRVEARGFEVRDLRRLDSRRGQFKLRMPAKETVTELYLSLRFADGTSRTEIYPLVVGPPRAPRLELAVSPEVIDVEGLPTDIATLVETDAPAVALAADGGQLLSASPRRGTLRLDAGLPPDAPSHVQLLAAASSPEGWSVAARGVSVTAPVRFRARIPRGWRLVVSGAEERVRPVTAPADGFTTLEGVRLRYGAPVRVFRQRRRRRKELALPVPTGKVGTGLVLALPGQAYADGGTGPTLAVTIPPDPFGGAPLWPDIEVEGARLVEVLTPDPAVKVLVLERPTRPTELSVRLDGLPAGRVRIDSNRGQQLALRVQSPGPDERAAALIEVRDDQNRLAPGRPRLRLGSGTELEPEAVSLGRWRVAVPFGLGPAEGSDELIAELAPLPIVVGEALELPRASVPLELARRNAVAARDDTPRSSPDTSPGLGLLLGGRLFGGTTFGSVRRGGLGLEGELELPILSERLGLRSGVELHYGRGDATITFPAGPVGGATELTGLLIPVEATLALFRTELDLVLRAGAALRYEAARVLIDGDDSGAGGRWGAGLRAGLEGTWQQGPGEWVLGALIEGLAASADGLTPDTTNVSGTLTGVRLEIGYRARLEL